jgi:hypothetical protein
MLDAAVARLDLQDSSCAHSARDGHREAGLARTLGRCAPRGPAGVGSRSHGDFRAAAVRALVLSAHRATHRRGTHVVMARAIQLRQSRRVGIDYRVLDQWPPADFPDRAGGLCPAFLSWRSAGIGGASSRGPPGTPAGAWHDPECDGRPPHAGRLDARDSERQDGRDHHARASGELARRSPARTESRLCLCGRRVAFDR